MTKKEVFKKEINYLKNITYRKNVQTLIELIPDYFFIIPAASTGKYHPQFAQGEAGLVRHTKVALKIAKDILSLEYMNDIFTNDEKDLLLIAIMFHDTHKLGVPKEKYTRFDHPLLAASFIKDNQDKTTFTDKEINIITKTISSHMGQWNTNSYSNITLPKPNDKYEFFVHMCDFLSSKKYLDVKFNEYNDIIE